MRLPAAPAEFTAERRGTSVDLQFVVPSANTDNTRPANVARVEVYAVTSHQTFTDEQMAKQGTKVATVDVKAPKDPNRTIEEDEPEADMEAPEGQGLDQGSIAHVTESLTSELTVPIQPKGDRRSRTTAEPHDGPLLPPGAAPLSRTYLAFGVSTGDKKGPPSKRLAIPLVPPPPPPGAAKVTYDENEITVAWDPIAAPGSIQQAAGDDVLPSRPLGATPTTIAYNVYDAAAKPTPAKLNAAPLDDAKYADKRITWGEERCYTVRSVQIVLDLKIESDALPPECKTLTDTFAPAAPANLQSTPTEGAINLIWDANTEKDLAGYIVLRGTSADALQPVVSAPIQDTVFRDQVTPGIRFTYVVIAVDRAGNRSPASKPIEEAAR